MILVDKDRSKNLLIFIACFCITISHLLTFSLSTFRWFGILLITLPILYQCFTYGLERDKTRNIMIGVFILLIGTCVCGTTISQKIVSIMYIVVLFLWYGYAGYFLNCKENFLAMSFGIGGACVFGLMITWDQVISQISSYGNLSYVTRLRVYGGFSHPNILGAMLASSLCCMLLYLFSLPYGHFRGFRGKVNALLIFLYCALIFGLVVLTNSRTALAMSIGFIIVLVMYKLDNIPLIIKLIVSIIAVLFFVYFAYANIIEYLTGDAAYSGRITGLLNTSDYTFIEQAFGHGLTNSSNTVEASGKEIAWASIHFKTGYSGLIVFACMILSFLLKIIRIDDRKQKYAAFACWVFAFLSTLGDPYLINIANTVSLFIWAGTSSIIQNNMNEYADENIEEEFDYRC